MDMQIPDPSVSAQSARGVDRVNVLKRAKLVFSGAILDCAVLDLSPSGARLSLGVPVRFSGNFALHMPGGSVYAARLCWARGREVGLEFIGEPRLALEAAKLAGASMQALRSIAPDRVLDSLRTARHFDDPALATAARALADAHATLLSALQDRITSSV